MSASFYERLRPAPVGGGFRMDGYWVWCGSVIGGGDGRYHMFASRWPYDLSFSHWVSNSEIVRAVADDPAGPYEFAEVVLPPRGGDAWDARMTHNPTIHYHDGEYLLFYTGTTYERDLPTPDDPIESRSADWREARRNQRIGLATAPSPSGPWTRRDEPVLETREGRWDALITTNPAPCVLEDGACLLIYKSVAFDRDLLRLGVAYADQYGGPYRRLRDEPILRFDETGDHVEDPYVWRSQGRYEMIMKDMNGGICGERGGGIHATSDDGVEWTVSDPPMAYSRHVRWSDGSVTSQAAFERPQLLVKDGRPTHLFAATGTGPDLWQFAEPTWNMVIPLAT